MHPLTMASGLLRCICTSAWQESLRAWWYLTRMAWLRRQAVVSFTWDSAGRTLSYPHEEFMAECGGLSDHLANLIRRLLHIKLVTPTSDGLTDALNAP